MTQRRVLSDGDRRAWERYARLVTPRPGVALPPEDTQAAMPAPAERPAPAAAPRRAARPMAALEVGAAPGGLDRGTWTRFRTGKLAPARTLDLHGHTVQRAHAELHAFLQRATSERLRCVEVITGRGGGESGGAIRREFSFWINAPGLRPLVLAASHPHAANPGSVRLLLKRLR